MFETKVILLMITAISMSTYVIVVFFKDVTKKDRNS